MDLTESEKRKYKMLVDEVSPKSNVVANSIKAFISGGCICVIGQFVLNYFKGTGLADDQAALATSILLILAAAILTGFGVYDRLGKYCGAGTIVPITGFSNSVVSPAIEYKKEGYIFGMAAKMFSVAGPVIVYGTMTSVVIGLVHYFIK